MGASAPRLRVDLPAPDHHRALVSCQRACPVRTDARGYVRAIAAGRFEEAYLIARGPNPFASICGRVCGAPCEAACRRGRIPVTDDDGHFVGLDRPIAIRALKRFACEQAGVEARDPAAVLAAVRAFEPPVCSDVEEMAALLRACAAGDVEKARGERVAIVGAGPAGLSAAHDLALLGFAPTVYESEPEAAGMLAFGVPDYRLPRELIRREVAVIRALGVDIRCGVTVGRDLDFASLRRDFAAVVVAVGAKRARLLGLPGESGPGVFGGVDFLRAVSLGDPIPLGARVVVIGGGNVAYDVARSVVRQAALDTARTAARQPGAHEVRLVALETLEEMPADTVEIREGDEEGIERLHGWGPTAIERDGSGAVVAVSFQRCLRVYDEQRRFAPVFDAEDRIRLDADTVLLATGQTTDLSFLEQGGEDVEHMRPGWPRVDPQTLETTAPGVFVAGDLAHGTRLLIDAVASGKRAARSVYRHVTGRAVTMEAVEAHFPLPLYQRERGYEQQRRVEVPTLAPELRLRSAGGEAASVELGYDRAQAMTEASRCLDCGITPVFDGTRCVLCGGCADVCPTLCLKLIGVDALDGDEELRALREAVGATDRDPEPWSAIVKDEDRCIRCGLCALRCPVEAIDMERTEFVVRWSAA
ncbi:MAG TPA: FAD-dependent oxidoreductase [Thermoanaerobaculia bacterium]|nr:FAD-dependent oxidoreductase [Thermoanaerobaculia bacterium]